MLRACALLSVCLAGSAVAEPSQGDGLTVEGVGQKPSRPMTLAQAAGGAREMTYIGFRNTATQSKIFARLNDAADYQVRKEGDNLLVLEIRNASIPLRNNKNHLDTTFFDSPVKMITPTEIEDASPTIRIVIEMKEQVTYSDAVEGRDIVLTFKK